MRGLIVVIVTCALALGCNKKKGEAAEGSASAKTSGDTTAKPADPSSKPAGLTPSSAVRDPWGDAPAETNTDLGASTGGRLSKVEPKAVPAPQTTKVDVTKIAQPTAPSVDVKGFTSKGGDDVPPGFSVTYNTSGNTAHEEYRASMEENKVFDTIAEGLNKTIRVPQTIAIETVDCNTINAFYDPSTRRIIVC